MPATISAGYSSACSRSDATGITSRSTKRRTVPTSSARISGSVGTTPEAIRRRRLFDRPVARERSVHRGELCGSADVPEASCLEQRGQRARHVVTCRGEAIQELNREEQPAHEDVGGLSPIGNMELPAGREHAVHLPNRAALVFGTKVMEEQARDHTIAGTITKGDVM